MSTLQQIISVLTGIVLTLQSSLAGLPAQSQLAQVVAPTSGLVGYWNFDSEGSTGKIGQAKSFNGTSDYYQTSSSDLKTADSFTVSAWIKADSTTMRHILWQGNATGNGGGDEDEFALNVGNTTNGQSGQLQLFIEGTNNDINIATTFSDTSNWNHVSAVVSGLNTSAPSATLYLNGASVGTDTADTISRAGWDTDLRIGRPGVADRMFDGLIDEVRVYNRALSASEITDVMNDGGGTTPPPPSPTPVNGSCGLTQNSCSAGTFSDVSDTSTDYLWSCQGSNGGTTASCSLPIPTTPPPPPPSGNTFYIRDGGTSSTCSDWTNACDTLPATLQRGATYYIADGSYGSYTFDDAESGTSVITIKKATISDHGTNTGWQSAYGDGQATFSDMLMLDDYYVIDGQTRNESNWQDTSSYGFRNTGSVTIHTLNYGRGSNNITFRYIDVGGPVGDTFSTSLPSYGFYFGGFGQTVSNWTISKSHIHNVYLPFQIAGADNISIEYSWIGPNWSKETIRGQIRASNIVIRHNVLKDGCQGTPGDPTAGGCTGQIAMWDGNAGNFDGSKIYGNLIWTTKNTHHSDAVIMIGGDGNLTAAGAAANNVLVYNNTIVGIQSGQATIRFPGSHTGDIAQNNIWHGLGSTVNTGCSANTCTNNVVISSASQFVNSSAGNFRLAQATANGTTLSSPYNTDMDNRTRGADGVWDLGAYEYIGGTTPPPPTTYTITASSGTGGTISPTGSVSVNSGSSQVFTITPNTGYSIQSVTVSGASVGAVSAYTFSNVTSNQTISATFSQNTTPPSTKFTSGQRVQATPGVGSNLNVRSTASASGTLLGTQPHLALGTIISGGQSADGFFWWNVNFDSGVDGYVVENYLTAYTVTPPPPTGNTFYIRDGGTSSTCSDWANACDILPSALQRGATYYVADGSYGSYTFDDPNSGTSVITIKKATASDHGTNTGWQSAYGDGQAVFGSFVLGSDYLVIDGSTRNESNWADGASYGFRISSIEANTSFTPGICASNILIKYVNGGGAEGSSYTGSEDGVVFKVGGFDESCTNWTIQRTYAHNIAHYAIYHMNGLIGGLFEYNWLSNSFGKEAIRGQINFANVIIRNNVFKDACGATGVAGEGCTAEIAIWDGNNFNGNEIYGNLFHRTKSDENSGGTIVVGGNGGSWVGPSANNTLVYNNTIAGIKGSGVGGNILINGGTGNVCRNNLWYDVFGTPSCTANTVSNNIEVSTNPFINYVGSNLRLATATQNGTSLSSPYNTDMDGKTRGSDGVWDLGAYEFTSGIAPTPTPTPSGNTFYIRDGGSSTACTDWANACDTLPTTLNRGAMYYVADGSYVGYNFDDANSGTTQIIVKKATQSDHGTDTGWNSTYGDGQAIWGSIIFTRGYYTFDGVVGGGPGNWESGFGFKINGEISAPQYVDNNSDFITIAHVDLNGGATGPSGSRGMTLYGHDNFTIKYSYIHDIGCDMISANVMNNFTIEYSKLARNHQAEPGCHGDLIEYQIGDASNFTIRHNFFEDIVGSYAFGSHGPVINGYNIYGNIFYWPNSAFFGNGLVGALSSAGTISNLKFYNNTMYGNVDGIFGFGTLRGSGNEAYNNIWVQAGGSGGVGFGNATASNNTCYGATCTGQQNLSGSPFVNPAGRDFRLSAASSAGTSFSTPYNIDMNGAARGLDGTWDRGALEFSGGSTPPPPPPPIVGDFNLDGLVNSLDLSLLTGAWNTSNATYDLNSDGQVNSLDYAVMVQNWSS